MIYLADHEHELLKALCRDEVLAIGEEIPVSVAIRLELAGLGVIARTEDGPDTIVITKAGKAFNWRTAA